MHAELAAVPDSLYNVTRANRVIAVVLLQLETRMSMSHIKHELRIRGIRGVTVTPSPSGEISGPITMRFPDGTEETGDEELFTACLAQCTDLDSLRRAIVKYDLNSPQGERAENE